MEKSYNSRLLEMLGPTNGKVKVKEERVLKYLLEHEDEIQNLSIEDIAEAADVSKATVVRFCKSLDFNGLKDFKVWYEAGKGSRYADVSPVSKDDDGEKILLSLGAGIARCLSRTLSPEKKDTLDAIVSDVKEADSIIFSGEGEAEVFARMAAASVSKYFPEKKVFINPKEDENASLCLAVSVTGKEKGTMDAISRVVFDGGKADVISSSPTSLISRAATNAVIVSDEPFFAGDEHMFGKYAILSIIDFITVMIGKESL